MSGPCLSNLVDVEISSIVTLSNLIAHHFLSNQSNLPLLSKSIKSFLSVKSNRIPPFSQIHMTIFFVTPNHILSLSNPVESPLSNLIQSALLVRPSRSFISDRQEKPHSSLLSNPIKTSLSGALTRTQHQQDSPEGIKRNW